MVDSLLLAPQRRAARMASHPQVINVGSFGPFQTLGFAILNTLASMEMFVRVVETGSFAAAAEASGVTPTMVAKHIKAIEQRLGATLLHRTTR
jgi:hypothetical protein